MLKRFIEQLSPQLGFADTLAPNDDASYSISFEPKVQVTLKENNEQVIKLYSKLAPLPKEKEGEFLLYVMSGNLFGTQTAGNIVGLDDEGKIVTLNRFIFPEATYPQFKEALEEFVNYAEAWKLETKAFA